MHTIRNDIRHKLEQHTTQLRILYEYLATTREIAVAIESQHKSMDTDEYKEDQKLINQLEDCTKKFLKLKYQVEDYKSALSELQHFESIPDNIEEIFDEKLQEHAEQRRHIEEDWFNEELYKKFKSEVWNVHRRDQIKPWEEDEEITVSQGDRSIKCPLTQGIFVEPVRSRKCGHTFSKAAVYQYIAQERSGIVPCPVAGCRERFRKDDLEPDIEMEIEVKKHKERERENMGEVLELDDD